MSGISAVWDLGALGHLISRWSLHVVCAAWQLRVAGLPVDEITQRHMLQEREHLL